MPKDHILLSTISEMTDWNKKPVPKTEKHTFITENFLNKVIDDCPKSYDKFKDVMYEYKLFTSIYEGVTQVAAFGIITQHLSFWYKAKEKRSRRFKKYYKRYILESIGI